MKQKNTGFTLVELIAVLVIIGILGVSAVQGAMPTLSFQMQSGRDQVITAFFTAQQRAMAQSNAVRLTTTDGSIDIREDTDGDSDFLDETSLSLGGISYPITLQTNQDLTDASFDFDRLGGTGARVLVLSQDGASVNINVTSTGYIH